MADPEFDDLMGLDLSQLDLEHIELDRDREPSPVWRWVGLLFLLSMGGVVLWLPSTRFYQNTIAGSWLFATICIVATVTGVLMGRWLWRWAEDAAARWARNRRPSAKRERKPPGPVQRWFTLIVALGGAAGILFAISPNRMSGGSTGYSGVWYLTAIAAVVVGGLVGRWLLMQQSNPFKTTGPRKPIVLPPWFKWVTLTFIIGGSVVVMLGLQIFSGGDRETVEFSLGGGAFVIGIVFAIWVARRFDETESKIRRRVRGQGAPGAVTRTSSLSGSQDRFTRR